MPKHGKLVGIAGVLGLVRVREADEVEDERVDDFIWESVLFIDEHTDEKRIWAWRRVRRRCPNDEEE
jgi:hypothetical protein